MVFKKQRVVLYSILLLSSFLNAQCNEKPVGVPLATATELKEFSDFLSKSQSKKFTVREVPHLRYWTISSGEINMDHALVVGDLNNDGEKDYMWITEAGTLHVQTFNNIYQKKKDTFVPGPFLPGYNPGTNTADDFDPGTIGDPFLVKACGKTYLRFKSPLNNSLQTFLWEKTSFTKIDITGS